MAKILLVEDDEAIGLNLQLYLEHMHHTVEFVTQGEEASDRLKLYKYDLVILDWNLPKKSGVNVCREFRAAGGQTPVLMLTSMTTTESKVTGLDGGADDYMTKPFDLKELGSRVAALLRRVPMYTPSRLQVGQITIDVVEHTVLIDNEKIHLLPKEFALLELFLKNPGQLLSNEILLNKVWTSESDTTASVVRTHVHNLRKRLQSVANPTIATVHGLGYRLELDQLPSAAQPD